MRIPVTVVEDDCGEIRSPPTAPQARRARPFPLAHRNAYRVTENLSVFESRRKGSYSCSVMSLLWHDTCVILR